MIEETEEAIADIEVNRLISGEKVRQ